MKASSAFAKTAGTERYEGPWNVILVEFSPEILVTWGYTLHVKGLRHGIGSLLP